MLHLARHDHFANAIGLPVADGPVSTEQLWKLYFSNPAAWWDNRLRKVWLELPPVEFLPSFVMSEC